MGDYTAYDGKDPLPPEKPRRPHASDWETIRPDGLQYSKSEKRYWLNSKGYDEVSALHNGIIGAGEQLRGIIGRQSSQDGPSP